METIVRMSLHAIISSVPEDVLFRPNGCSDHLSLCRICNPTQLTIRISCAGIVAARHNLTSSVRSSLSAMFSLRIDHQNI